LDLDKLNDRITSFIEDEGFSPETIVTAKEPIKVTVTGIGWHGGEKHNIALEQAQKFADSAVFMCD